MQIFLSNYRFLLLLLVLAVFFGCSTDDEIGDKGPVLPVSDLSGTVSGTVTDSNTKNPILDAVVNLLDREVITAANGTFTFHDIPYAESLRITVEDPRYETYTHTFALNQEALIVNASLTPLTGTVSGTVTDATTNNPIPGAVVNLLGIEVKTETDGIFTIFEIPYIEEHEITVEDPDYQSYTHTFTLDRGRLVLKVELTPLYDSEDELNAFLENFSDLIESLDFEKLLEIQELFSETYVASDDPVTALGILSGDIPTNYEAINPTFTNIFEKYSWLQFVFKNRIMDITHARKASIELLLDVDSENAVDKTLRHIEANCVFEFRREGSEWKITHWQLLDLDIRL